MPDTGMSGFAYFKEGFRLIRQPGIRLFVVIPILINLLVFVGFFYFFGSEYADWVQRASQWLPGWLHFLAWLLWLIFALLILVILVYGFVMVANLLGAPFYGMLSEQVEKQVSGQAPDATMQWHDLLLLIPRSLWREVQKLLYYLPRVLAIFLLGFVPMAQAGAPFLSLLFSSWMMAIQYVDYPADNQRISLARMRHLMRQRRLTCSVFGACTFVASMIPLVNLVAVPAAVAGGTLLWVRELRPLLATSAQK